MSRKTGISRAKFTIETVECLRKNLQKIGSNLLVAVKKPEDIIGDLLKEGSQNVVVFQSEICYEEIKIQKAVEDKLEAASAVKGFNAYTKSVWG
jgi:deoxyribodipyrimidine photo-lyase